MKIRIALATATALGLVMSVSAMADDNRTKILQNGQDNEVSVDQDGAGNYAGENNSSYSDAILSQIGSDNSIVIEQTGNNNRIGDHYGTLRGAHQTGDGNLMVVSQETGTAGSSGSNGNIIWGVRQTVEAGSSSGSATNNELYITQKRPDGSTLSATHFVGQVHQTLDGNGSRNLITVTQTGENSSWYGGQVYSNPSTHGNKLIYASQDGTGNTMTVTQAGVGVMGGSGGLQLTGPRNAVNTITQDGQNHTATVTQNGYRNYVQLVSQEGTGNTATISLTGEANGANTAAGVAAIGVFTSGRGAELAGASASTVSQNGGGNQVSYTVSNGDNNQFGFFQDGDANKAIDILITGDRNELGVFQDGTNNVLVLSTITGDDNIIGLIQKGTANVATLNVSGNKNVGYNDFGSGPAGSLGLTAGLLEQHGTFNQVSLTVTGGDNNVFASRQNNSAHSAPTQNQITATQNGSWNQAAVSQIGNNNNTMLNQTGSNNNAMVSQ